MNTASVRLRFAQVLLMAAIFLLAVAAYSVLSQIITIEQPYADRPDADIPSFVAWRLALRTFLPQTTAVEEKR